MQDQSKLDIWRELAAQLRVDSISCTTAAGSGHPSSSLSAADLMAVLLEKYLNYAFEAPAHPSNDRLVFSKGHASPLLYAMYRAAGVISHDELLSLRRLGSRLEGHPSPRALPWVDVATGSLGQGLAVGVGMALCAKHVTGSPMRAWVLLGDSEMAEGSVWEAFDKAGYYKLDNLIAILDMNRLGQQGETAWGWNSAVYAARARAFGWQVVEIDGHDLTEIDKALGQACRPGHAPTCVVAKTVKGQGVKLLADREGWHGKALPSEEAQKAIAELGGEHALTVQVQRPPEAAHGKSAPSKEASWVNQAPPAFKAPLYRRGNSVATRQAYGDALVALGRARKDIVVLDAEVSNSTHTEEFKKAIPERFFEMFIAEQQMVSAGCGFAVLGQLPFVSTFACFLTRAFDQIRMAAISGIRLCLCGSHAGISIGEDGPSQMGLEDLAMMRAVYGSTVLYPSDAVQTAALMAEMVNCTGIVYLRTTRGKTPVIYGEHDRFTVGGSKVLRGSQHDQVTLVAAGITVHEALKACDLLHEQGIACRLIDAYSVKPIDRQTLYEALTATEGRLVVAEDHWLEGGLGAAVLEAIATMGIKQLRLKHLAVRAMPGSGTPAELMRVAGIDAQGIAEAVVDLCSLSPVEAAS